MSKQSLPAATYYLTPKLQTKPLWRKQKKALPKAIGFESDTMVLTYKDVQRLADLHPFKGIAVTPETRLLVTFVKEPPKSSLMLSGKDLSW
jgi:uncharacterized protein (DUF1697 family)